LEAIIRRLEAVLRDLQAQLGRTAGNSSQPPWANPPAAAKPVVNEPTGRSPGGQPGHARCERARLPAAPVR
jgi:transposase